MHILEIYNGMFASYDLLLIEKVDFGNVKYFLI